MFTLTSDLFCDRKRREEEEELERIIQLSLTEK